MTVACDRCGNGKRHPDTRARLSERDGRVAVVREVPVEVCDACGEVWLSFGVAQRLDTLFDQLLASNAEASPHGVISSKWSPGQGSPDGRMTGHRGAAADIDEAYEQAYRDHPLDESDDWGDVIAFRDAAS